MTIGNDYSLQFVVPGMPIAPVKRCFPPPQDGKKICGPDVTEWLVRFIQDALAEAVPYADVGYYKTIEWWVPRVRAGGPWDIKKNSMPASGGSSKCPIDCDRSIMICGKCVLNDVAGNILFALAGEAAGLGSVLATGSVFAAPNAGGWLGTLWSTAVEFFTFRVDLGSPHDTNEELIDQDIIRAAMFGGGLDVYKGKFSREQLCNIIVEIGDRPKAKVKFLACDRCGSGPVPTTARRGVGGY